MKILYIHQYFNSPEDGGSTRSYWISQELIKHGHEVVMITSTRNRMDDGTRKNVDGIEVIYLDSYYNQKMGFMGRLKAYSKFMFKSTKCALKQKDIDLVIATSTPLTIGFPALVLKLFKKTPYLFEVRDLWPEVPIQMGALNNYFLRKMAIWFEHTIYKHASHIVALSPGMLEGVLDAGVEEDKVTMIPNMSKIDEFWSRPPSLEMLRAHNLREDTFKVIYFGSMGRSNAVDYILDAVKLLKDHRDIEFIFLGYGMTDVISDFGKKHGLTNIKFLGRFSVQETSELVNLCDVSLVTFTNIPILYTNSPNKLFDSLSAGKPIIVNSPGWTKDLVEKNNCGIYVHPESPAQLAKKLVELKNNPELLKQMGQNSRKLAETKYDKSILCDQFASVVNGMDPNPLTKNSCISY